MNEILEELRTEQYNLHAWDWLKIEDERLAQEEALAWLAYLSNEPGSKKLQHYLDDLTDIYVNSYHSINVHSLFDFLFEQQGFSSPNDQFYHPDNSNLIKVLQKKEGLQISLTMVAVFMARRLNLPLYGFNMPGHFLIMHEMGNDFRVYDPFSKGEPIPKQTIIYIQRMMVQRAKPQTIGKASTEQIVLRVFRNFLNSYQRQENSKMYDLYNEKFMELKTMIREKGMTKED